MIGHKSDHTIAECARWLEEDEVAGEVLGVLRSLHPGPSARLEGSG